MWTKALCCIRLHIYQFGNRKRKKHQKSKEESKQWKRKNRNEWKLFPRTKPYLHNFWMKDQWKGRPNHAVSQTHWHTNKSLFLHHFSHPLCMAFNSPRVVGFSVAHTGITFSESPLIKILMGGYLLAAWGKVKLKAHSKLPWLTE